MVFIGTHTESYRQSELEKGRRSLYYFSSVCLGFVPRNSSGKPIPNPDHPNLCAFLEGRPPHRPWNRAMVCAYRHYGKSVSTTFSYPLWRGIYINGFSTKIIGNSSNNVKINFINKIDALFRNSQEADRLQWLFSHRIPPNFEGWNTEQIKFLSDNPLASPTITHWGLESRFEGWHGNLVVLDDPEGADADKSGVGNRESYAAYQRAIPLVDPQSGQVLIVATPHGPNPLVYRIRDLEEPPWHSMADNARTYFQIFWRPLTDANDKISWPEMFSRQHVEALRKEPSARQQFWLERRSGLDSLFDMDEVKKSLYQWAGPSRDVILYTGYKWDPDKVSEAGFVHPEPQDCEVDIRSLRYYIHFDPKHRSASQRSTSDGRPTMAAITVVGVAADYHVFLIDHWANDDADIDRQAAELFRLYCKWGPRVVTFETIGAQIWAEAIIRTNEKNMPHWARPVGSGPVVVGENLPRLSTRLRYSEKNATLTKEFLYREFLSMWVNHGILHFNIEQKEMLRQLEGALDENCPLDLLDCLAQGPVPSEERPGGPKKIIWQPPAMEDRLRGWASRRKWVEMSTSKPDKKWGWGRTWGGIKR